MTQKQVPARPTASELEILQILWEHGPATVRTVNDALNRLRPVGYTTTLKLMQIMFEKGLLRRDESQRSHSYAPAINKGETQQLLLNSFVQSAFGGSAAKLVMQALANHKASTAELNQIRTFLDQLQGDQHDAKH